MAQAETLTDTVALDDAAAFYKEHGWFATGTVLPIELIDRAHEVVEQIDTAERDGSMPTRLANFLAWPSGERRTARLNQYIAFQYRALAAVVFQPIIGEIAAHLADSATVRLFNSALIVKEPGEYLRYARVGWHCDLAYWPTCSSRNMLTAWIPLQDTSGQTGTLAVLDGSHRWPECDEIADLRRAQEFMCQDHESLQSRLESIAPILTPTTIELQRGEVSFHHGLTMHGSGVNLSDRPRSAISVHIQDVTNAYRREAGARYVHDKLVLRQPNGEPDYGDPEICPTLWPRQSCAHLSDTDHKLGPA